MTTSDKDLGEAVAAAACAFCVALEQRCQTGHISKSVRANGAERLAVIVKAQLAAMDEAAFVAQAKQAGKRELAPYIAEICKTEGHHAPEAMLDRILDEVLQMVANVVAQEKVLRLN